MASDGADQVIWREGTWRCESTMIQAQPVLRLYDGDTLGLEHEVMPGTVSAVAEAMRQSVLRFLAGEVRAGQTPRPGTMKVIGPGLGVLTICRQCRSLRAYLRGRRSGKNWYFCPDCTHQWNIPSES